MKKLQFLFLILTVSAFLAESHAQQQQPKPEATEFWEPEPKVITPGEGTKAPSDAIVLFDGKDFSNWASVKDGNAPKWEIKDGAMVVVGGTGDIVTKQTFGNFQLHIEWRTPEKVEGNSQGRGNSGIFLQERYEVQVLDSYQNRTYSNGQAGSLYKQTMPLVNACRKPGEWQTYDIIYTAPKFSPNGGVESFAKVTVIHNGVVVQNATTIQGTTEYIGAPKNIAHGKGGIKLQDHGNPTSFRNIWIREM
jgi:Domain of Unknown Function (DUF1080)